MSSPISNGSFSVGWHRFIRLSACGIVTLAIAVSARAEDRVSIPITEQGPDQSVRLERTLRELTEVSFTDNALPDALKYLSDLHRVEINLDKTALMEEGISPDQPISLVISGISVRSALNLILKPLGLDYYVDDSRLNVTTGSSAQHTLTTRLYRVQDLVDPGTSNDDYKRLVDLMRLVTAGWFDEQADNPESISSIADVRSLVIRTNYHVHREIEGILTGLRQAKKLQTIVTAPPGPAKKSKPQVQANPEAIEAALRSVTNCDFKENALDEVLNYLEDRQRVEIWLDKEGLADEGVSCDQQISLKVSGVSLQSALELMLEPLGLTYLNEDEVLKITTQSTADEKLMTRVYPVRDLVDVGDGTADYESLTEVIVEATSGKWMIYDQEGGSIVDVGISESLVIRQTQKVHREIEGLLSALRQLKKRPPLPSIPVNPNDPAVLNPLQSPFQPAKPPAEPATFAHPAAIEQALRSPADCAFKDTSLEEALHDLQRHLQISIRLDTTALNDEGIDTDEPLTFQSSGTSLETALQKMLQPLDLTYVNEREVLNITTRAVADEKLMTRVYPVHDLVDPQLGANGYDVLINGLQHGTTGKWVLIDQEGGAAAPHEVSKALVIRQSQRVHREIEGILSAIRQAIQKPDLHSLPTRRDQPETLNPTRLVKKQANASPQE